MSAPSKEVSRDDLERLAFDARGSIEYPAGGKAGWARLTIAGRRYHAWCPAGGQVVAS